MNSRSVFATNLRRILHDRELTAADLARLVGVDKSAVGHWLKERSTPSDVQKDKICEVLGIHISDLYAPADRLPRRPTLDEALKVVNDHMGVLRIRKIKHKS